MLTKLSNSWHLVKASASVLRADKELVLLPMISGAALIAVSASFFVPLLFVGEGRLLSGELGIVQGAVLFLYYMAQYTVIIFFNTALVGAAMKRLSGGNPTVGDGLRMAWSRLGTILGYAAIAATVGLLLRAASERAGFLGKLVIGLVGVGWNLATFLVVPVLVSHDVGPIEALKRSATTLKRTWGEQIAGNVGLGFFFGLSYLLMGVVAVASVMLAVSTQIPWLIAAVVVTFVLAFILLAAVQSALSGIYSAAVYRYASDGRVEGFDAKTLQAAFVRR